MDISAYLEIEIRLPNDSRYTGKTNGDGRVHDLDISLLD